MGYVKKEVGYMQKKHSMALSFLLGGITGGLLAVVFAPQLLKTRKAVLDGAGKIGKKLRKETPYEGVYCAEEGICSPTAEDTDLGFEELVTADKPAE